jgi:hypothetical protein
MLIYIYIYLFFLFHILHFHFLRYIYIYKNSCQEYHILFESLFIWYVYHQLSFHHFFSLKRPTFHFIFSLCIFSSFPNTFAFNLFYFLLLKYKRINYIILSFLLTLETHNIISQYYII